MTCRLLALPEMCALVVPHLLPMESRVFASTCRELQQHAGDAQWRKAWRPWLTTRIAAYDGSFALSEVAKRCGAGKTALHHAVRARDANVTFALLAHGAPLDAFDYEGRSCLHHACDGGNRALVRLLLGAGADPGPRDARTEEDTPLHDGALS